MTCVRKHRVLIMSCLMTSGEGRLRWITLLGRGITEETIKAFQSWLCACTMGWRSRII